MNKEKMTNIIETERLVLFPYTKENLDLFNKNLKMFEKEFQVIYDGETLDDDLKNFLIRLVSDIEKDINNYLYFTEFLIVLKKSSIIIGSIDFKYVPVDYTTEVGYGMSEKYEGLGYMTEALMAFLEFGRSLGIKKVLAETKIENIKSQNVLKRCGFSLYNKKDAIWWCINL